MKPAVKLHLIRVIGFQFDLILDCSKLRIKRLFVPRRKNRTKHLVRS